MLPPQTRRNISHRKHRVTGGGSSPDSGLMLTSDKSLCAFRDQDKEVKKLFPRKKISSFTSAALDVAKKPHWNHRNSLWSQEWLLFIRASNIRQVNMEENPSKDQWATAGKGDAAFAEQSSALSVHSPQMRKFLPLLDWGQGLGWSWQCSYSISNLSSCSRTQNF